MIVFSTADERFQWKRTLLAGHSGTRNTRAAASWPNPLYVRFRPGVPELAHHDLPFTVVQSVDDLLRVLAEVGASEPLIVARSEESVGVETLVIDALHHLEALLGNDAKKMDALMTAISALPVHVVLLCRLTHKEERQFPLTCLSATLLNYVDVALVVEGDHLQAHPDDRLPWVLDRSGQLPPTVALTFTDDYARLARAMGQGLGARAPHQVTEAPRFDLPSDITLPPPPAPRPAPAAAPVAAPPAPVAPAAAAPVVAPPAPVEGPAEGDDGDEGEDGEAVDLPMCTSQGRLGNDCLGRVESNYARDVSVIRFRRPMCGPCNDAEYEAMPKKIAAAPRRGATGPAPDGTVPPRPRDEDVAVVPHGEVVGQVPPNEDQDLRAFLKS